MLEYLKQFEGILGVLAGVFAGWFLKYLDKTGKVSFHFSNQKLSFSAPDGAGGFTKVKIQDNPPNGILLFDVLIYNTSNDYRIIKDISALIKFDSKVFTSEIMDIDNPGIKGNVPSTCIFEFLNMPPKSIIKKKLAIRLDKDDLDCMYEKDITVELTGYKLYGVIKKLNKKIITIPADKQLNTD